MLVVANVRILRNYGPPPISAQIASDLINKCPQFRTADSGTREVKEITRIAKASLSGLNNYDVVFLWRWTSRSMSAEGALNHSRAEFDYRDGKWHLLSFKDGDHGLVQVREP
jgi:hypothetical protein